MHNLPWAPPACHQWGRGGWTQDTHLCVSSCRLHKTCCLSGGLVLASVYFPKCSYTYCYPQCLGTPYQSHGWWEALHPRKVPGLCRGFPPGRPGAASPHSAHLGTLPFHLASAEFCSSLVQLLFLCPQHLVECL